MVDEQEFDFRSDVRSVCDILDSTLGPFGATKLVVEADGTVTSTADGSAVLDRLALDNPMVTLLQSGVSDFRADHGDGATSVVTVLGGLLREASQLRDVGCHPTAIEHGFDVAMDAATEYLHTHARTLDVVGPAAVAETALTGSRDPGTRRAVASTVATAVEHCAAVDATPSTVRRNVHVVSHVGASTAETDLVEGVVLQTEPVGESMPRRVEGGVAVLSGAVDVPHASGLDADGPAFEAGDFETRAAIADHEWSSFERTLSDLADAGCHAVFTTGGVNDRVRTRLANQGIVAFSNLDDDERRAVVRATGAAVVPNLATVSAETLGTGTVAVQRHAGSDLVHVRREGSPVTTLFCRAPDPRSVDAFERSVEAAVASLAMANAEGRVVPSGGASEVGAARAVRRRARSVEGRAQLAAEAFADGLLAVPLSLARTAGLDGWTTMARLGAAHADGRGADGVDVVTGETRDVLADDPIVDPLSTRVATWDAAADLATRLLRVDDVVPASSLVDEDQSASPAAGPTMGGSR